MPDVLRIRRRITGSPLAPASLANAELAYNEVSHTLFYGEGTGGAGGSATVVIPIAGSGAFLPLAGGAMTGSITMGATTDITLGRDGSATMHAVTKRQLDALTTRVAYIEANFIKPS